MLMSPDAILHSASVHGAVRLVYRKREQAITQVSHENVREAGGDVDTHLDEAREVPGCNRGQLGAGDWPLWRHDFHRTRPIAMAITRPLQIKKQSAYFGLAR